MTAYVLYVDHQGHPAPLMDCYHSAASRRLSSTVPRYPPSVSHEIESAYCPHCLSSCDTSVASRYSYCPKPSCLRCPICQSTGRIAALDGLCYYECTRCDWNSQSCQLTMPVETVDRLEMIRAAEELRMEWNRRVQVSMEILDTHTERLTEYWEHRRRNPHYHSHTHATSSSSSSSSSGRRRTKTTAWSLAALESTLVEKKAQLELGTTMDEIEHMNLDDDDDIVVEESLWNVPTHSFQMQSIHCPILPATMSEMLPLPVPLRVRNSIRCRAEMAQGRPGILLKPKINPLDGDSSVRSGQGQWWKKDSSACHVVPNVQVIKIVRVTGGFAVLLKVGNPTVGNVRLRLGPSSYHGEPDWDEPETATRFLPDVFVDTLMQTKMSVNLLPDILKDLAPTVTVDISSAEETMIELGGRAHRTPETVARWTPSPSLSASSISLLTQELCHAWFELCIAADVEFERGAAPAVAFSLQIDVGSGSWESSLVQPVSKDGSDFVVFDLVLVIAGDD